MAEKALCSCGCGRLVSASTDYRHRAGKTTLLAQATCLASQSITATTTKFHPTRENSPQRKRQRTNPGPLPPLEPVVHPCAEAWTNASRYRATVEDADSDEESDADEGATPSSESEDGDGSSSDSDSSDDGLGIEDTINDEFERELGNFGAYPNLPSPSQFW
jgi:hypothetical protein